MAPTVAPCPCYDWRVGDVAWARLRAAVGVAAWVAPAIAYSLSAAADAGWGDSAELSAAGYTLGVAHPTGFGAWLVLARAATLVPLGTIAFRVNLLGGLLTAVAIGLGARLVWRLAVDKSTGVALGIAVVALLASSVLLGRHAASAEVYPLDLLLVACTVTVALGAIVARASSRQTDAWLGFLCGIGITHHAAFALAVGPVVLWAIGPAVVRSPRRLLWPLVAFATAAAVVVYLPLRAVGRPALDWGHPATLPAWIAHLSGARIRGAFAPAIGSLTSAFDLAPALWRIILRDAGIAALAFAPLSVVVGPSPRRRLGFGLWLVALGAGAYALLVNPMGIRAEQTGLTIEWALVVAAAIGALGAADRLGSRARVAAALLASVLLVLPAVWTARAAFAQPTYDETDYVSAALDPLPSRAIVLCTTDDICGGALYTQYVAGTRPDVLVLPRQHLWDKATLDARLSRHGADAFAPGDLDRWLALPERARKRRTGELVARLLVDGPRRRPVACEISSDLPGASVRTLVPVPPGILYAAHARDEATALLSEAWPERWFDRLSRHRGPWAPASLTVLGTTWLGHAQFRIARGELDRAEEDIARALRRAPAIAPSAWIAQGAVASRRDDFRTAIELTRRSLSREPERVVPRVNLGRYLLASGDPAGAEAALQAALDRNPTSADALGALGVAQARRGELLEAARSWRRALRFDPAQPEARAGLERLGAW